MEMVVSDSVLPGSQALEALKLLLGKCDFVILNIPAPLILGAAISEYATGQDVGELLLVIPEEQQIKSDLGSLKRFYDLPAALTRIRGERNINKILRQISILAPMKSSVHKILRMLCDPEVEFEDVEEVASKDPTLVMRMLKIANSAFFVRRMPLENLKMVMTFLGIEGIRQVLIQEAFDGFAVMFGNQREKLSHMRRCSQLATFIGKKLGVDQALIGKMRSAGLLHDLGALALCFFDHLEYAKVTMKVRNDHKGICEAEREVFGIDHQELGVLLAREMSMPDYLTPVMARHHATDVPQDDFLLMSVMLANGYLNEHIEKLSFTQYEQFLPILSAERFKNSKALIGKKDDDSAVAKGEKEEIFKFPNIIDVLKSELDQFILAGPEAQGL